jgi:glucokinase
MTLPVETAEGLRLRDYLARGRGRASVERAVSGQGLAEVYRWAAEEAGAASEALSARAITDRAARGVDPLCLKAAETVLRIFATIAGDLALAYLPYGGVYLAGSVARALAPMMGAAGFEEIFRTKGRQAGLVGSFPLYLITDDAAALTGCSALAALRGAHEMERTG